MQPQLSTTCVSQENRGKSVIELKGLAVDCLRVADVRGHKHANKQKPALKVRAVTGTTKIVNSTLTDVVQARCPTVTVLSFCTYVRRPCSGQTIRALKPFHKKASIAVSKSFKTPR